MEPMSTAHFGRRLLVGIVLAAMLAGCDNLQPPAGANGSMPQAPVRTENAATGASWMSPAAKHSDLLYVAGSEGPSSVVYVFSYPSGKPAGMIEHAVSGLCTDAHGNVFMTQTWYSASRILEYAHGGTKPISQLSDPYSGVAGCAVDSASGDLAVEHTEDGTTLIYAHARGKPRVVHNFLVATRYAAYNDAGALFTFGAADRVRIAELAKNGKSFVRIALAQRIDVPIGIQWQGKSMALGDGLQYTSGLTLVYQMAVKGRKAVTKGETSLGNSSNAFFIRGNTIAVSQGDEVVVYDYPGGGEPISTISNIGSAGSLTVSDAP